MYDNDFTVAGDGLNKMKNTKAPKLAGITLPYTDFKKADMCSITFAAIRTSL